MFIQGGRLKEGGVYFENFEKGGAFKRRGAFNRSNTVLSVCVFVHIKEDVPLLLTSTFASILP